MNKIFIAIAFSMIYISFSAFADPEPTKSEKRLFNITRAYLLSVMEFCQVCAAKGAWLFVKKPKSKCSKIIAQNTVPSGESDEGASPLTNEAISDICVDEYDAIIK